ncbi:PREDICTED: uncharacterized protein LOC107330504 [Acropora digitifera]|uniref:uncharacterized protein LOC107330504 n=1 Tax=Acropora digitifera TaxID=70779 RepID=UPI00077B080F|nr:PREDICTED: uncharacterized protein LOC107330504 [Acropora digitifera]
MGILIEQYRSRIGSHDNFVKTKDTLSHWKNHFLSLMFMMVFYNAYIPLLIRQANDVEENPGPTIFDVIDPTRTICADYSQGNVALFGENAGKQCVAMSLTAIIYHHIQDMNLWTSSTLNNILTIGNNLYISIRCSVRTNDYLLLTDVPHIVSICNKVYILEYSESLTGSLFLTSNNGPYMTLQNSLTEVFSNCQLKYNNIYCCLLAIIIGINTVAVFKDSEQSFKIFVAHSRDLHGMPHSFGKCTLLTIEGIENLVSYLQISCLQIGVVPFEIKGVFVRNNEPDLHNVNESPKIGRLPFNNKRNQMQPIKRKLKSLTETPEEKEKRLIVRREYEKRRRVNESEESKEKRLAQQCLKRKKKRANESSESRKKRLATQSQYQRQKIANESAEFREERLLNQRQYQKEKLANESADHRQERLAKQRQYQKEKNLYNSTITDEIRKFHANNL